MEKQKDFNCLKETILASKKLNETHQAYIKVNSPEH